MASSDFLATTINFLRLNRESLPFSISLNEKEVTSPSHLTFVLMTISLGMLSVSLVVPYPFKMSDFELSTLKTQLRNLSDLRTVASCAATIRLSFPHERE